MSVSRWLFDKYCGNGNVKETKNVEDTTNGKVLVEFDAHELTGLRDCIRFYIASIKDALAQSYETPRFNKLHDKIVTAQDRALRRFSLVSDDEISNNDSNREFHKFYKHEYNLILCLVKEEMNKLQKSIDYREKHDLINRACEEFYKQHLVALEAEERALLGAFDLIRQRINSILDCGDCKEALVYDGK